MNTQVPSGSVVVGVDGSEPARAAVAWAAVQAELDGRPLVLLHAATPPSPVATGWLDTMGVDHAQVVEQVLEGGRALLAETAAEVARTHPGLEVRTSVPLSDPRQALLDAAHDASLVVVGSRGHGPVKGLLLGSVSVALSKHAVCPVVVHRTREGGPGTSGVVVGVEGVGSDAAVVEVAFDLAAARGLPLTAVHCFWDEVRIAQGSHDVADDEPGVEDQRRLVADAVHDAAARHPGVVVRHQLSRGFVDDRLVRASDAADLLVVGHRRKPLLNEIVYGSLAPTVVEHARCPVVVVGSHATVGTRPAPAGHAAGAGR